MSQNKFRNAIFVKIDLVFKKSLPTKKICLPLTYLFMYVGVCVCVLCFEIRYIFTSDNNGQFWLMCFCLLILARIHVGRYMIGNIKKSKIRCNL